MASDIVVYDLTVSKIWCTMCANKIKSSFEGQPGIQNVQVNVMAERVILSFDQNIITLQKIKEIFEANNFFIVGTPRQINTDTNQQRNCKFYFSNSEYDPEELIDIQMNLTKEYQGSINGIQIENFRYNKKSGQLMTIQYQPLSLQGYTIQHFIENFVKNKIIKNDEKENLDADLTLIVFDELLEKFKKKERRVEAVTKKKLTMAIVLSVLFLLLCSILPHFQFYSPILYYPNEKSIFSFYLIFVFIMTSITLFSFGRAVYKNAFQLYIKYKMFNMDTLLTLGSLAAYIMSIFMTVVYAVENTANREYTKEEESERIMNVIHDLESAGLILTVITIGKYFEGKAKQTIINMQNQIFPQDQLLRTPIVTRVQVKNQDFDIDAQHKCEVSLLEKGDLILLQKGMKLLIDGVIVKGSVQVVDSVCYGWDDKFEATIGMRLKSGADILDGSCIFQVEHVIEGSMLFQIAEQLNLAQSDREDKTFGISALLQSLSQRFVQGVIIVALTVLIVWIVIIAIDAVEIDQYCVWCFPFERAISILVASCPCALGLAVPSVVVITLNLALKSGILVKKNTIFEQISKVKCVVFDKTGTLFTKVDHIESFTLLSKNQTEYSKSSDKTVIKVKQFQRSLIISDPIDTKREVQCCEGLVQSKLKFNTSLSVEDLWAIIGVLEKDFQHPIATLLFKESVKKQIGRQSTFVLTEQSILQKNGIVGNVTRTTDKTQFNCLIGNLTHLEENGAIMEDFITKKCRELEARGKTVIMMTVDKVPEVVLCLDNKANLRPEAKAVVTYLREKLKKSVYILSGDSKKTVSSVGKYLGIPQIHQFGEIDAQGKQQILQQLKDNHQEVMMIGDGLNDVLSLQSACVGVTINAKSELNLMASDVILLNENLWKITVLFNLMNSALKVVYINLFWAFAYNLIMAPFAAGVFYGFGIAISPMISSASMSLSSIIVVLISNMLRFVKFDPSNQVGKNKIIDANGGEESNSQYDSYIEVNNSHQSSRKTQEDKMMI